MHQRVRVRRQNHLLGLAAAARLLVGARLAVPHQHGHGHASGRRQSAGRGRRVMVRVHALLLLRPLRLVPVVLEPDLHLEQRAAVPSVRKRVFVNTKNRLTFNDIGNRPRGSYCEKNHQWFREKKKKINKIVASRWGGVGHSFGWVAGSAKVSYTDYDSERAQIKTRITMWEKEIDRLSNFLTVYRKKIRIKWIV